MEKLQTCVTCPAWLIGKYAEEWARIFQEIGNYIYVISLFSGIIHVQLLAAVCQVLCPIHGKCVLAETLHRDNNSSRS
jgi:hypothetical protein